MGRLAHGALSQPQASPHLLCRFLLGWVRYYQSGERNGLEFVSRHQSEYQLACKPVQVVNLQPAGLLSTSILKCHKLAVEIQFHCLAPLAITILLENDIPLKGVFTVTVFNVNNSIGIVANRPRFTKPTLVI